MQWTEEQRQAIEGRGQSLLVSAAAGSGKTAVLVERILRQVMDPNEPVMLDRMLVVTFTNAAAAQMKEKIRDRLQKALEEDPENKLLQEQCERMAQTSIMTIHSFCLQVIRDYITGIPELDPGFRIGDETEMELLRSDVLSTVLEEFYTQYEEDPAAGAEFGSLAQSYGGRRQDENLEELVLRVFAYTESMPNPEEWLQNAVEAYAPQGRSNPLRAAWRTELDQMARLHLEAAAGFCETAIAQLQTAADEKKAAKAEALLSTLAEAIEALEDETGEALYTGAAALPIPSRMVYPFEDEAEKAAFKKIYEAVKKEIEAVVKLGEALSAEEEEPLNERVYPALCGLRKLIAAFRWEYRRVKTEQNCVDFSDFEHYALRILRDGAEGEPTAAARAIREQYDQIYIDEYQDSNRIQELILTAVAKPDDGQVFMVGDVKQSIYRFRNAEPQLFMEKYETYGCREGTRRFLLTRNFRSRPAVLAAINQIFEALMSREAGEMEYGEEERLNPGAAFPEENPEAGVSLMTLLCPDSFSSAERFEAEAEWLAADIQRRLLQKQPIWDGQQSRPLQKEDIVILLRSSAGRADIIKKKLEQRGVACYAETESGFFDTAEIRLMLQILKILDNPRQDIPLAGVMYSPIFRFAGEELARIRLLKPEGDFYTAVQAAQTAEDASLRRKTTAFLTRLQAWRKLASEMTVHDLLWQIYRDSGYYLYAGAMPGGALRRANLDLLLEKSIEFEKGIYSGLFQFLRFLEKMTRSQKQVDEAKTIGEGEPVVRFLSFHKSKGLEFPLVYLAGLSREFNTSDQKQTLLLQRELGIGAKAVEAENYLVYETLPYTAVRERIRRQNLAEEMRVLYVAMTRAKEQLILTGTRPESAAVQPDYPQAGWVMPAYQALSAKSYMDWLEAVLQKRANTGIRWESVAVRPVEAAVLPETESESTMAVGGPAAAFSWQYPWQEETTMNVRFSVSEIKKQGEAPEDTETVPLMKGEKAGAQRGTAMHAFLAAAEFGKLQTAEQVAGQIGQLVQAQRLSEEDAALLQREELLKFGQSELCRRMQKTKELYREQPFILSLTLQELDALCPGWLPMEAADGNARVMIQGIIDCYFEEEEAWVLLDYKTDRSMDAERRGQYSRQLRLYQTALERITGRPVKERLLYWTRTGEEIHC